LRPRRASGLAAAIERAVQASGLEHRQRASSEHSIALHVSSQTKSRSEVHEIIAAARAARHGPALTHDGHRLVNLRHD
jgi:hypothetical protein